MCGNGYSGCNTNRSFNSFSPCSATPCGAPGRQLGGFFRFLANMFGGFSQNGNNPCENNNSCSDNFNYNSEGSMNDFIDSLSANYGLNNPPDNVSPQLWRECWNTLRNG